VSEQVASIGIDFGTTNSSMAWYDPRTGDAERGATSESGIVRCTIAVVDGQPLEEGARVFAQRWGETVDPPAITVYRVAGLAHPSFLVEIDAIATR
jgi:molecular chaperone DnaK (HSP70)